MELWNYVIFFVILLTRGIICFRCKIIYSTWYVFKVVFPHRRPPSDSLYWSFLIVGYRRVVYIGISTSSVDSWATVWKMLGSITHFSDHGLLRSSEVFISAMLYNVSHFDILNLCILLLFNSVFCLTFGYFLSFNNFMKFNTQMYIFSAKSAAIFVLACTICWDSLNSISSWPLKQ
jgi:hypothetical protein